MSSAVHSDHQLALERGRFRWLSAAGESVPTSATRLELVQRLAVRLATERARIVALPLRVTTTGARRRSRKFLTVLVDLEVRGWDWVAVQAPSLVQQDT